MRRSGTWRITVVLILGAAGLGGLAAYWQSRPPAVKPPRKLTSAPTSFAPVTGIPVAETHEETPRFQSLGDRFVSFSGSTGVQVTKDGVRLTTPEGAWLTYRFLEATAGGRVIATDDGSRPALAGTDAVFARGALTERYRLVPEGVEQFFDLASAPEGDLVIRCRPESSLPHVADQSSEKAVVFGRDGFVIRDAVAIDANGARLPLALEFQEGQLQLAVPHEWLASAAYPVTIDPLIGGNFLVCDQWGAFFLYNHNAKVVYNSTDDEYLCVWIDAANGPVSGGGPPLPPQNSPFGQRLSASSGALIGSKFSIAPAGGNIYIMSAAYSAAANRYLVTYSKTSTGVPQRVRAKILDNTGADLFGELQVAESASTTEQGRFHDSALVNGQFLVVYEQYAATTSGTGVINGRYVNTDGTFAGASFPISATSGFHSVRPSVACLGTTALVAWSQNTTGTDVRNIMASLVNGTTPGTPFQVNTTTGSDNDWSQIAANPTSNEYLVIWDVNANVNGYWSYGNSANPCDVIARRVTSTGSMPGGEIAVATSTDNEGDPRAAWSPADNQYVVTWSKGVIPTDGDSDIRLARLQAGADTVLETNVSLGMGGVNDFDASIVARGTTNQLMSFFARRTPTATSFKKTWHGQWFATAASGTGPSISASSLRQFRADGATVMLPGESATTKTVVLSALATDPDSLWQLHVEVKPVGVAFSGSPTATNGPFVASGTTLAVTISGLEWNTDYHWQARAADSTGNTGPWVSFGGNAETAADFKVMPATPLTAFWSDNFDDGDVSDWSQAPVPSGLLATNLSFAADADPATAPPGTQNSWVSAPYSLNIYDNTNNWSLFSEIRTNGSANIAGLVNPVLAFRCNQVFTTATNGFNSRSVKISNDNFATTLSNTTVSYTTLDPMSPSFCSSAGTWHVHTIPLNPAWGNIRLGFYWYSSYGQPVGWFIDDVVIGEANVPPAAPTLLAQGSTALGGSTSSTGMTFYGTVTDPAAEQVRLEVEVKAVGTGFDNSGIVTGSLVASGGTANATVTGLTVGGYHWRARTVDSTGFAGPWVSYPDGTPNAESAADFSVVDLTAPAAVTDLLVTSPGITTATLSWTAPGDDGVIGTAASYDIRVSTAPITAANFASATQLAGAPTPAAPGTVQTYAVTGLFADTQYYFAIKTADEIPNWSAISNVVNATTLPTPDTTAPAAISNLSAGSATPTSLVLSWTSTGDDGSTGTATGYDVRYSSAAITAANFASATPVASGVPAPLVAGTAQTMTVTGLNPSTTYFFAIRVSDEAGNNSLSNSPNGTTLAPADVTAPAAITNLAITSVTYNTAALSWTAPGDDGAAGTASSYAVRYSTSAITAANWGSATPVSSGVPAPLAAGTTQTMTVTGLSALTTYFFAICTSDEVPNTSAVSNCPSDTTPAAPDLTPPGAIGNLQITGGGTTSRMLQWTATGDDGSVGTATSYEVRYSTSALTAANFSAGTLVVSGVPTPTVAGTTQTMIVNGLQPSTTYWFGVKAHDEAGNSSLSNIVSGATNAPPDTTLPTIAITAPSGTGVFTTPTTPVTIQGTAGDNVGVTSVTWTNAGNTTSGTAAGTTSWSFSAALAIGDNTITVTAHDAANNVASATIVVTYNPPSLAVSPSTLTFSAVAGGANPASQTFQVTNPGAGTLNYVASETAPWLSLSPETGATPQTVTASVTTAGLTAGTYTTSITITAAGSANTQTVDVTLTLTAPPEIDLSPSSLTFTATAGGANPAAQTVAISNIGGGTLDWTASDNAAWLTTTASGTAPSNLTASVNIAGLAAGTYSGQITVTAAGAANSPQTIFVTLQVNAGPAIGLNPTSLNFTATAGGTNPASQNVAVSNTGGGTLNWTASDNAAWLTTTTSGTAPSTMAVNVDITGLAAGTYNGTITVSATGATSQTVAVTLTVNALPTIGLSTSTLSFAAPQGGPNPVAQTVSVTNTGGGTLNWTASDNAAWLTTTTSGTAPSTMAVNVDITGLAAGTYNGTITVTAAGATNSPQTIPVTLTVNALPAIGFAPTSLTFTATQGAANPASQTTALTNTGGGTLTWTASDNAAWLSVSPASGSLSSGASQNLTASIDIAGLTPGTYTGSITVTAAGAANSPQSVTVTLTIIAPPAISLSPTSLAFTATQGGANPASQNVNVTNTGGGTLAWTASDNAAWLSETASGTAPSTMTVSVDITGLAAGTYNGTITVSSAGTAPQTVAVTLTVIAPPAIGLTPTSLTFAAPQGGPNPIAQNVTVSNNGGGTLAWGAAETATWLTMTPATGSLTAGASQTMSAIVDVAGLAPGTYTTTVTVSAAGAAPQTISVTLTVSALPAIGLNPTSLTFAAPEGGPNPVAQTVTVTNTGGGTLAWNGSDNAAWLSLSPASGSLTAGASQTMSAVVDVAGLAPGTYNATITVSAAGAASQTVAVALTVSALPAVGVAPSSLAFTAPEGGPNPAVQSFSVSNVGGGTLNWTLSDNAAWMTSTPGAGTLTAGASQNVGVAVDVTGLAAGTYTGTITVTGSGTTQTVAVTLTVNGTPALALSSTALTFSAPVGGPNPVSQTVTVTNSGTGVLAWSAVEAATWMSVSPVSGSLTSGGSEPMAVTIDVAGLAAGTYTGTITVMAPGVAAQVISVTLDVNGVPVIGLTSTFLSLRAAEGSTASTSFAISNVGSGVMNWTMTPSAGWLSASPSSGTLGASTGQGLTISAGGLAPGTYTGTILVTAPGAANSGQVISVTLTVDAGGSRGSKKCGLVGLEAALMLAMLVLARRARK